MNRLIPICLIVVGAVLLVLAQIPLKTTVLSSVVQRQYQNHWILPIPVRMPTLNPQKLLSATEKSLALMTFSRLVKVDEGLQIQPDLLETWNYDIASNTYYFKLKQNLKFHDGSPLTVDDVIFSIHQWALPTSFDNDLLSPIKGVSAYTAGKSPVISGITRHDNYSFYIHLNKWVDSFVRNLSVPRFCVYPKNFQGRSKDEFFSKPIGSGPYKIAYYSPAKSTYVANSNYYLGPPLTESITVIYYPENTAVQKFEDHELDNLVMYDIVPTRSQFKDDSVIIHQSQTKSTLVLVTYAGIPETKRFETREYIAQLPQKTKLIDLCYPGSKPASTLIPPGLIASQGASASVVPNEIQSNKANKSFSGIELPRLTLHIADDVNATCLKSTLREDFKLTTIHPEIEDFNEMYALLKRNQLQIWIENFEFKNDDPISTLQYFSNTSNEYLLGLKIPILQQMFSQLSGVNTDFNRAQIYKQIDSYLIDNHYITPLLHLNSVSVQRKEVHGAENLRSNRFSGNWHEIFVEVPSAE